MKEFFNIKFVSDLLNIPEATLRFWESKNLFSIQRDDNNYRMYNLRNILDIADVMSYINLNIPLKDIPKINLSTDTEQYEYINEMMAKTDKK